MKKVAIIGGGSAGLSAAKHMLTSAEGIQLHPVVFEQTNHIGGTWVYEDNNNEKEIISSVYKNLRSNLPKQVMNFPDFPFPDSAPSYLYHTTVHKYLEDYAKHFNVIPHIRFQTKVVSVNPLPKKENNDEWCKWLVKYQQVDGKFESEEFDNVVLCNGRFTLPNNPSIPGLHHYKNKKLHSCFYRNRDDYIGTKKALVLGFGQSGTDILLQLAEVCDTVYFAHNRPRCKSKFPDNTVELTNISHVTEEGAFVTETGDVIDDVDLFVMCTGYLLSFPFLSEKVNLKIKHSRTVENLYKMVFCIDYPSLCIVGLPYYTCPFPTVHQQSAYITKVWNGTKSLPSREEMLQITEKDWEKRRATQAEKNLHALNRTMRDYWDDLATLSGTEKNPKVIDEIFWHCLAYRIYNFTTYKNTEYKIINENEFEFVC